MTGSCYSRFVQSGHLRPKIPSNYYCNQWYIDESDDQPWNFGWTWWSTKRILGHPIGTQIFKYGYMAASWTITHFDVRNREIPARAATQPMARLGTAMLACYREPSTEAAPDFWQNAAMNRGRGTDMNRCWWWWCVFWLNCWGSFDLCESDLAFVRSTCRIWCLFTDHVFNVHPDIGIELVCVCVCPFQKLWPLWLFKLSVFGRSLWLCVVLYSYQGVFGLFMAMFGIAQGKQKPSKAVECWCEWMTSFSGTTMSHTDPTWSGFTVTMNSHRDGRFTACRW